MVEIPDADYVIVGAGSSGCALAGRLAERTNDRILLIEAGGRNDERLISMPFGVSKVIGDPRYDWCFTTESQTGLDDRRLDYPRGKGLGGSSAINWMAHVRGTRTDYDGWRDAGCPGWDWATVLPYFKRMEDYADGRGDRGHGGPLKVTDIDYCHPIIDGLIEASRQAGLPSTDDYNGADAVGMSRTQLTVRKGRRCSSYVAYIKPLKRSNLQVLTDTEVLRIQFNSGRATGVEIRRGGRTARVSARREVILSAGAIATPVLLERSGIGDAKRVASLGLPLIHHAPGVGENLQDQMVGWVKLRLKGVGSLNQEIRGWRLLRHIAQYALFRRGMLAGVPTHSQGFARASPGDGLPDVQLLGLPITYTYSLSRAGEPTLSVDREPGISLAFLLSRPDSRGYVHAAAADSAVPPRISPNFLSAESDQRLVVSGLRLCRRIFQQRAFDQTRDVELAPGPAVQTDEDLLAYARAVGHSSYHPVGTCRMGSDDAAVLDPRLRVRGVECLRVVDASAMPRIVSGNTNAAAILIGERGADLVMAGP